MRKIVSRSFALAVLPPALWACASTSASPVYDDIGIRLSGVVTGTLIRFNGCYAVDSNDAGTPVILILPRTTRMKKTQLVFDPANGGRAVSIGEIVTLWGGYTEITDHPDHEYRHVPCKGDAFLVNSVTN